MKNSVSRNEKSKSHGTVAPDFSQISQVMSGRGRRLSTLVVLFLLTLSCVQAQVSVTVTGNTNTTPNLAASYTSLASAVTALNSVTAFSGPVVLTCAAGSETAPAGGYTINFSGTTSSTNTVTVTTSGTVTITAPNPQTSGALNDAIFKIIGSDWVTISGFTMRENASNTTTTSASNNMTEFGVALFYATTTNGAQNCTIQNNTISLNRTYQNTFGIYANSTHSATTVSTSATATGTAGGSSGLKIYGNTISNANMAIVVVGPTAAADQNNGIDIGGTSVSTGNTISNIGTTGTFSSYANLTGTPNILVIRNSFNVNCSYNNITSSNGGVTVGSTFTAINFPSFSNASTTTSTNTINNNTISMTHGLTTGTLVGIIVPSTSFSSGSSLSINNNNFATLNYSATGSGAVTAINQGASVTTISISNNTFTNLTVNTTGNFTFINHNNVSAQTNGSKTINGNNIVTGFNKSQAGGTVTIYTDGGSSTTGTTVQNNNNNFSNITLTGATTVAGWSNTDGTGATPVKTISGNTFSNWNCGSSAVTVFSNSYGGNTTISGNTVSNINGTGAITGWNQGANGTMTTLSFSNNSITGLTSSGTGGTVLGLTGQAPSTVTTANYSGFTIGALSSTAATVTGMNISGATANNIFNNKIYSLSSSNTSGVVTGLVASAGTTNTIYNNIIGGLTAGSSGIANAVIGMNISGGTTANVYHNSIYLNATSTGSLFGTSGLMFSSTPSLNLRNNIIYNTSASVGATVNTAALRRSTTGTAGTVPSNYSTTSNNNLFYAGTPGASNLIYTEGVSTTFTNSQQTIAAHKSFMGNRDQASASENIAFQSTTGSSADFLKFDLTIATQAESGGSAISGITTDYGGTTRNASTPDMGAWELDGVAADLTGPVITYTALSNTLCANVPTLTATITDASEVNVTSGTSPRLYYKKSTDTNTIAGNTSADNGWKFVETTSTSSPFTFTINAGLLQSPIVAGDNIQYFVVAQDNATTPNIGINSGTFTAPPASVSLTSSEFPLTGIINSYSVLTPVATTVTIGTSGTYPSLTGAGGLFAAINAGGLTDNTVVTIIDASVTETGANSLNQIVYGCSGPVTLTIKPQTTATLTGSVASGALIRLNGADNVIIDGSNNEGTDRSLTITNTATTAPTAIWLSSTGAGAGATNNIIRNCVINASAATSATAYGISVSGTTIGSAGADNDNVTIQNNLITSRNIGIYANGSAATSEGGLDNLNISGNTFNSVSTSTLATLIGMRIGNSVGSVVSRNTLSLSYAGGGQPVGISLETGVSGAQVTRNNITQVNTTNTGGYGSRGITVGTGSASSNITIANNNIAGVNGSNYSAFSNSSSMGIAIGVIGNSATLTTVAGGINLYHNTVNMYGSYVYAASCLTTALYVGSGASSLDIRNNIFVNSMNNTDGGGTGSKNYAIYSAAANTAFSNINYNDYFVSGSQGVLAFLTSDQTTLSALVTAFGGNANSISGDPLFNSNSNLQPQPGSLVLAAGVTGTGVAIDYTGTTRGTPPSIGSYEVGLDGTAPVITYVPLPNTVCTNSSVLTATITDLSGINTTSGTSPRLYYRKSTDANTFAGNTSADNGWKFVETTSTSSPYSFTLNAALLQAPIASGDVIQYFVVAQDMAPVANVGINTATFTTAPSNVALTSAAFPVSGARSYNVLAPVAATVTVGTGGDYPTLTGAGGLFAAINAGGLVDNATVTLIGSSITETGANALNQIAYGCSGPVTLTIKPQTTVTLTGSVASGALIRLNGADNVIIDGSSSGGTDRSLTITNTATTAPTAIWLSSTGAGAGATNNTIRNCVINTSAASTATAYGISVSGATIGSSGADNDNVTIQNNLITSTNIGVYANGSAAVSAGGLDNLNISGNTFNSVSTSTLPTLTGIQIGNAIGSVVSRNNLSLVYAAAGQPVGISLETGVNGAQVSRNNITQVATTDAGGYGGRGITVGTGSTSSNITIANNNIAGVNGSNFSAFSNSSSMGIAVGVIGNSEILTTVAGGINLYNNSVNMSGNYSYTANCLTTALYIGTGASALDIRNNIFVNSMNNTNSSGTASKNYAFYSAAANSAFANINFNDYHVSGTQGTLGFLSSNRNTLAALRTATGQDVNSLSSPPSFVSSTNLHLNSTANDCLDKRGTPIAAITTDFDGDTRDAATPDIGMDEFTSTTDFSIQVAESSELTNNDGRICSGATAVLTASNGTSYLWSSGASTAAATVSPVSETAYTVTITLTGCTVTSSYTVLTTALPVPSFSFTETSGVLGNDGIICVGSSATVTAAGGNGFLWSNGNSTSSISVSPTTTTTYTVTVTDANNCSATSTSVVSVNALPVPAISYTETSGNNPNDGTICAGASVALNASGGTSYTWNTGDNASSVTVSPTAATTYTVTVTDANACFTNTSATVSVNSLPTPSISFTDGSGNTNNDGVICLGGQATLTVSGNGSYLWGSSETTQSVTVSPTTSTSYSVTFTDTNGCSGATNATVTVNTLPAPQIGFTETSGNTPNDGVICQGNSVTLSVSGMTSHLWDNNQTTSSINVSPSSTASYTVSVTDSNGCNGVSTTTVSVNSLPVPSIAVNETSGTTNNDGIICVGQSVTLAGGGGSSYLWNTGASTSAITVSPSSGTSYTVTATDQNNCSAPVSTAITVNVLPTPSVAVADNSGVLNDGIILIGASATLTASGGTSYLWDSGATTAALTVTPGATTTYIVTVTNANGCSATSSTTITVVLEQLPIITVSETSGNSNNDGKICTGASATLTASNGVTFVWSTGTSASAITVAPTATTTYTVTATDSFGLTSSASTTVTVFALPTPSVSVAETSGLTNNDGIICVGASTSLTATGGVAYLWNTGGNDATITVSPSATTTYTVTVTNENGCSATTTRTITVNALPTPSVSVAETSGVANNDGIICVGASASLSASGGTSYLWSNGATTTSISVSPTATATYTVTATNANGCSATSTRTITVNDLPTPAVSASDNSGSQSNDGIICIGASATLAATGGVSYVWNTSATTTSITVSPTTTTTYSVTATNANMCSSATTRTVTVNPLPTPSVAVAETSGLLNNDGTVCAGANAVLTASGGTSYVWNTGATTASVTVSPTSTTTYTVTATNSNGCTATSTRSITVTPLPSPSIAIVETSGSNNNDGSICIGAGASLTASGGNSYSWSNGSASASITVSPSATTTYTVTVTNANGCSTATSTTIVVNPLPVPGITVAETSGLQTNDGTVCNGSSATLSATGGASYVWSNGGAASSITVTPSATTSYSVTVTSAAGCSAVTSVTITVSPLPVPSLLTSDMSGLSSDDGIICSGAAATLTISGGTTYLWSNSSTSISITVSPSATTTYTVTVTSSDACVSTATRTVVVNALPVPSFSFSETSGLTNNDGIICAGASVMVTAGGGSSYAWNTGGATSTITVSPSSSTTYTVTVTNVNGCSVVANSTVTVNTLPSASIAVTEMSGAADNDGIILIGDSATLTASGGTSYNWSTSGTTAAITVTPPVTTTYTVTVTNSNGCTSTANTTITASLQQMPVITVTETSGIDNNDGVICTGASATLTVAGGSSYLWSNGSTSTAIVVSPSVTTTYTVTDTDSRGNTTSTSVTIVVNSLPSPSISTTETSGVNANDGIICAGASVTLAASGGTSYSWSNGGISSSFSVSPSSTTTFTVTVTNANGCTASASVTITVNSLPVPSVSVSETSGVANNDGITCVGASAVLTATGGTSYAWSNAGTNAAITVAPTVTTTYTVTVTNANGCSATTTRTISVTPLPAPVVSVAETSGVANNDAIICIGASATVTATGGATYLWNDGSTANSIMVTPSTTTTYTVTVTNANNCSATATSVVTVNPLPTPVINVAETSGLTNNDGIVCVGSSTTLTATGGTVYSWSNGSATAAITVSPSVTTTYTVTVTNANGCSATTTRTITVNTLPIPSLSVSETSGAMNNDGNICLGSSAVLVALGGTSYVWSNGATASIITVTPSNTTTYTVTVSNANGCTATATTTVTVFFPPTITAVSTVCAPVASVITLTGNFFTGTTQVSMNGTNCPSFTVISATQINVSKPIAGPIQSVSVTNTCGSTSFQVTPSVTSFSPASGQPGTIVNITGVNLACLQSVTIGSVSQIIMSNNDNSATVFIMPGSTTGPITVTSTNGSSAASSTNYTVSATPNPYVQQGTKQLGSGATGNAQQGTSVAVSSDGNTAVVGGSFDDSNKGAAWIFVRNGTTWSQQGGKLVGSGAIGAARQGTAVAISADGNTIAVGGPLDNTSAGAVWIFTRSSGVWSQQGSKLVGTGAAGNAQQGTALSLSATGNILAVGGVGDDLLGGATWMFSRDNSGVWSQTGSKLVGSNMVGKGRQGNAVALSSDGTTLIVGGNNDNNRRGAFWIFTNSGGSWSQQGGKLFGSGGSSESWQGSAVAISANGNTVLVGGSADNSLQGAAWVFTRSGGTWTQQGNKIVGTGFVGSARQGSSVGLSADGNTAVIGGFGDDSNKGAMWVFKRNGTTWTQQGSKVNGSGATGSARQGTSISLSSNGTTAAIGGPADATNKGAFWIFVPNTSFADTKTDVRAQDEQSVAAAEVILYQNLPNPLTDRTNIIFTLPEACTAEWQITDINGRVVLVLKRDYPAGDNSEVFDMNGYQGVYYYTLKTPFGTKTKKMVVVK